MVLLIKLWNAFFGDETVRAAYMHIVEGDAQMKTWGTEEFFKVMDDTVIVQGDELVTSGGSKVIVEFLDGTIMRLDGGTDVTFEEIDFENDEPLISVLLVDGGVWFNKIYRSTEATTVNVKMSNVQARSNDASIFALENSVNDVVRVFGGEDIDVDIFDEEGAKVVETEVVGVGQEVIFTDAALERYWQFQSPSIIDAVSDEFKKTDWYTWNRLEDRKPTKIEVSPDGSQIVKVEPQVLEDEELTEEEDVTAEDEADKEENSVEGEDISKDDKEEGEKQVESGKLSAPTITSVSGGTVKDANGFYNVKSRLATIVGGAPAGATKITVNGYVLQKFQPGDTTWTYYANADYALMKMGENIYEVVAEDAEGNKSAVLTVKVLMEEAPAPAPAPASEENASEGEATTP